MPITSVKTMITVNWFWLWAVNVKMCNMREFPKSKNKLSDSILLYVCWYCTVYILTYRDELSKVIALFFLCYKQMIAQSPSHHSKLIWLSYFDVITYFASTVKVNEVQNKTGPHWLSLNWIIKQNTSDFFQNIFFCAPRKQECHTSLKFHDFFYFLFFE